MIKQVKIINVYSQSMFRQEIRSPCNARTKYSVKNIQEKNRLFIVKLELLPKALK